MDSLFEIFNILKEVLIYIFSFIFILSIPVFLHELGHILGLNHPFDNSDGDCIGSTEEFGNKTAHTGLTVMAYEDPPKGWEYLQFYSKVDILALQSIFGKGN